MATVATNISSPAGDFTNDTPITFNILFSGTVEGFTLSDIQITNGSGIALTGSGANWTATVSADNQGDDVTVFIPGAVTTGTNINLDSNIVTVGFSSVRPRPVITYDGPAVTNNHYINVEVDFGKDVTGLTAADFNLTNCTVKNITGSGSNYSVRLVANKSGIVEFFIKNAAATDIYGNNSKKSNEISLQFDPISLDDKYTTFGYEDEENPLSKDVLINFTASEINQVAEIQSLADCAKDLPQRLLKKAEQKAFELVANSPTGKKLAGAVALVVASVETIQTIIDTVQPLIEHPETLAAALLEAQGLTGDALRAKVQYIADTFANVSGLETLLGNINALDICSVSNYSADGSPVQNGVLSPTSNPPGAVFGVDSAVTSSYDSSAKDAYDEFTFQLKESLEINSSEDQSADRARMISVVTTLAMGYHDDIAKSNDSSRDDEFFEKYSANVSAEKQRNLDWTPDVKEQFDIRSLNCGNLIRRNTQVIRTFMNRNKPLSGSPISVGITTYSGPDKDFTTFLDIKPSQRPAELTAYWSRKYNIADQERKLAARGIKTGTLNYSDAYRGAYGTLISDQTVASSRFPGGSIIALRNSDGTPYNPTGNNASGVFKVTDTGNAKLTYAKPDVFTSTPEKYTNMGSVHVFLISEGSQKGKQYILAQSKYAGTNTA